MPKSIEAKILLVLIGIVILGGVATFVPGWFNGDAIQVSPAREVPTFDVEERFLDENYYRAYDVPDSTQLIVTIGDSYTGGYPVDVADSYPSVLERRLAEAGLEVSVMNAGRGDTGLDEHLVLLTDYILPRLNPSIVIVQLHPNDTADNVTKAHFSISADNQLVRDAGAQPPAGADNIEWGREKFALEVQEIRRLANQQGFAVHFALIAPQSVYRDDISAEWALFESLEYQNLHDILSGQGALIDIRFDDTAVGSGGAIGADLFVDADRDPMELGLRRFNERGYELLAERIANNILRDPGESSWLDVRALDFTGSQSEWMISGWNEAESADGSAYAWSEGPRSVIEVALPTGTDLKMTLEVQPFEFPGSPSQQVEVFLNDQLISSLTLNSLRQIYEVMLPQSAIAAPTNTIELGYGYNREPQDVIPGSEDTRSLGAAWHMIAFSQPQP